MAKKVNYSEGQIIDLFQLERIEGNPTLRMRDWLDVATPDLDVYEAHTFEKAFLRANKSIFAWSEEDLKMKFISDILPLGHLEDNGRFLTYFEKNLSAVVKGTSLSVKTDFMVASGSYDVPKRPYFHFQEYKPTKNPSGDSMAQLLEAMLIAQHENNNTKPIYGCEVVGKNWTFVILENTTYCLSSTYNSVIREDLLKIIAILRKFRYILESELLD